MDVVTDSSSLLVVGVDVSGAADVVVCSYRPRLFWFRYAFNGGQRWIMELLWRSLVVGGGYGCLCVLEHVWACLRRGRVVPARYCVLHSSLARDFGRWVIVVFRLESACWRVLVDW